ncbi:TIGR04372 family glycosyltransferase [Polynucleobacter sp. UB-Tiil-W10]|uniref:TIGR04372 family glycosyltransferase n=1 Tax=Polynucleobacter sp. UB-Tiil-W10 TaxID=1855648 RepID=UPI001C0C5EFB|nr:TIGR04372 family glycosyltransferase [Polynucleobacter sp. UB-Tiil-W10]MBU3540826.1 TIGR04372 family glycosyltransferase [Polynucleobacter sp. UB-Tiil-W10]
MRSQQFVSSTLNAIYDRFFGAAPAEKSRLNTHIRNRRLRSYLYLLYAKTDPLLTSQLQPEIFRQELINEKLDAKALYLLGHHLFNIGKLDLACEVFVALAEHTFDELAKERQLEALRFAGITSFLLGKITQASHYWVRAGKLRRTILGEEFGPMYRIVGSAWYAAIGHVAMLDFYVKYNKLYRGDEVRVVAAQTISLIPGEYLCKALGETGIEFLSPEELSADYDLWAMYNDKPTWETLTPAYRSAMIDDFWEFEFPDGEILGYTHAANRIQKDWERQQRPPLLSVTAGEQKFLRRTLSLLGLPDGAWYVCLHVRESGFHKGWNTLYPTMRDANIDDYLPAIDLIVKQGGWVIRMGDPSMKPLPPMAGVIDYAHSTLKTPKADILIAIDCRFFLGTNSGFATIPAIYGVRCVFSNWVPIGLPLWPSQDLMMPKLFWNEHQARYLSFDEVFSSGLAFIQNWADLPKGIILRDNTPQEILELTAEALGITSPPADLSLCANAHHAYQQTATQYNGYCGSRLADSFVQRHHALLLHSK